MSRLSRVMVTASLVAIVVAIIAAFFHVFSFTNADGYRTFGLIVGAVTFFVEMGVHMFEQRHAKQ